MTSGEDKLATYPDRGPSRNTGHVTESRYHDHKSLFTDFTMGNEHGECSEGTSS